MFLMDSEHKMIPDPSENKQSDLTDCHESVERRRFAKSTGV